MGTLKINCVSSATVKSMSVQKPRIWSEAYQRISTLTDHSYSFIICHHVIIINHTKASFRLSFVNEVWSFTKQAGGDGPAGGDSREQCTETFRLGVRQTLRERKPPSQRRPCIWVHQDECNQNMLRYLIDLNTIHNMNIYIYMRC